MTDRRRDAVLVAAAVALAAVITLAQRCGGPDTTERFAALSSQGGIVFSTYPGTIDPTNPAYGGGMATCSGGCSAALLARNAGALKAAIDAASNTAYPAAHVDIPGGQYPIGCVAGQHYGVDLFGDRHVVVRGHGTTLRFSGDQAGTPQCAMLWLRNTSDVQFQDVAFSMRDVTNATADTLAVKVGDAGATSVDSVRLNHDAFVEGAGGDYLRLDGGTGAATVTRVTVDTASRFESSARAAIDVRSGTAFVNVMFSFFRNNASRDVWFEATTDGQIGQAVVMGNLFERNGSGTAQSVTLTGFCGSYSLDGVTLFANRVLPVVGTTTGGGVIDGSCVRRLQMQANTVVTATATAVPTLALAGDVTDSTVTDNVFERDAAATSAAVLQVASDGVKAPVGDLLRANRVQQYSGIGAGIDVSGCARCSVEDSRVTYHHATADSGSTGFVGILCSGSVNPCSGTYERNSISRDDQGISASLNLATVTANDATVVQARRPGTGGNADQIKFVSSGSVGGTGAITETISPPLVTITFRPNVTTVGNVETLFLSSALMQVQTASGSPSTKLQNPADVFGPTNLAGALAAGRMLAGIKVVKGTQSTVNRLALRANYVFNARDELWLDADGAAQYPEGFPLVSQNVNASTAAEFEPGLTSSWRLDTTGNSDTVASGALSPSTAWTFVTTNNTVAYTLADGPAGQFRKCGRVKSTTGAPAGTLTFASNHLADGTTHTLTWGACNSPTICWFCLTWDPSATTWRMAGKDASVTLN